MDIPRVWVARDPRNPSHIAQAMALLQNLNALAVTKGTLDELAALGMRLNQRNAKVQKRVQPSSIVIGAFYFLDQPQLFPDNVIVKCAVCKAALQIRPAGNIAGRKLCCFCAVDKLLKAHWASAA